MADYVADAAWHNWSRALRQLRWLPRLGDTLGSFGVRVNHVRRQHPQHPGWHLLLGVPERWQTNWGLAPEVLLLASPLVHGNDLERARETVNTSSRVDPELVLVADGRAFPDAGLSRLLGLEHGRFLHLDPRAAPEGQIARHLPLRDLFDQRRPVRGRFQVFGRERERRELRDRLLRGEATTLLGLRKMGKTTLAAWVTDELADEGMDVRRADLQGLGQTLSTEAVVRELVGAPGDGVALRRALDAACAAGPVVLFIDEFDYLFAPRACVDLVGFFGALRAVAQATGRLGVVLSGRDPRAMTAPMLQGAPNPFLVWTRPLWLGGLERPVADALLQSIGTRVGLRVDSALSELAWRWSAGHPLAHRWVGSAVLKAVQRSGRVPPVPTEGFVDALPAVLERDRDQRLLAREVDEVLPEGARALLAAAARGATELEGDADDLELLENLGVLVPDRSPSVPGYLTAWYQRQRRRTVKLSA